MSGPNRTSAICDFDNLMNYAGGSHLELILRMKNASSSSKKSVDRQAVIAFPIAIATLHLWLVGGFFRNCKLNFSRIDVSKTERYVY